MNYWYVSRPDELMIDLDSRPQLEIALRRLRDTGEWGAKNVFVCPSSTPEHYHLVIQMAEKMEAIRRMVYQLYFMDHVYRSCKNFFRVLDGVRSPSLLISPHNWRELSLANPTTHSMPQSVFWRKPDAVCRCSTALHKDTRRILKCPAHIKLRGKNPYGTSRQ